MSAPGRLVVDAHLFVLDDCGVLLSEARQELFVLNAPATFVWCRVEDGAEAETIVREYTETFGVAAAEARRIVADLLYRWQGLGLVSGVDIAGASPVDLVTALGRLLTTPALRRRFAGAPDETARALPLRAEDAARLVGLGASAIDAQAWLLEQRRNARRKGPGPLDPGAAAEPSLRITSPAVVRRYRLLDSSIELRFSSTAAASLIDPLFAHLAVSTGPEPPIVLDVIERPGGWVVCGQDLPFLYCVDRIELAPLVKSAVRRLALERHRYFVQIHAAVLAAGDRCLALPAAAGSGKTTLAAALAEAGLGYFSDEYALLERPTMAVRPVPLPLTIKPGAADLLASRFPCLAALPVHRREDDQLVRYLPPPHAVPSASSRLPVAWLVFPHLAPGTTTALLPLGRPAALEQLLAQSLVLPEALEAPAVEDLIRWMRTVECFELVLGDLDAAVREILMLCATR